MRLAILLATFVTLALTRMDLELVLPELVQGLQLQNAVRTAGPAGLPTVGALALFASVLGAGLVELFGGGLSDRFGRGIIMTIGLAGFSTASVLTALVQNLNQLIGMRLVLGGFQGLFIPAALAFVGEAFPHRRGLTLQLMIGMFSVGAGLNGILSSPLVARSGGAWQLPPSVYGVIGLGLSLALFAAFRDGTVEQLHARPTDVSTRRVGGLKRWAPERGTFFLVLAMCAFALSQFGYLSAYTTFLHGVQHFTFDDASFVTSVADLLTFVALLFIAWAGDHIGRRRMLLMTGAIAVFASVPVFTFTTSFWPAVLLAVAFQACNGSFLGPGIAFGQDLAVGRRLGARTGLIVGTVHLASLAAVPVVTLLTLRFVTVPIGTLLGAELLVLCILMVACIFFTAVPRLVPANRDLTATAEGSETRSRVAHGGTADAPGC